MKTLLVALGLVLAIAPPADARKKKKPATSGEVKKGEEKPPKPGDPGVNEDNATGRTNATRDAARDAEGPTNATGRRP